jgi:site-specific DNA recombinase
LHRTLYPSSNLKPIGIQAHSKCTVVYSQFEASFVKKEKEKAESQHEMSLDKAMVDIVTLRRRDEDLEILFKRIYEDMVSGRLTAERFVKLSSEYEKEQKKVKEKIAVLQELIDSGEQGEYDLKEFLKYSQVHRSKETDGGTAE